MSTSVSLRAASFSALMICSLAQHASAQPATAPSAPAPTQASEDEVRVPYASLRSPAAFDEIMDRIWHIEEEVDSPSLTTLVAGMLVAGGWSPQIDPHALIGAVAGIRLSLFRTRVQGVERYADRIEVIKEHQLARLLTMIESERDESTKRVEQLEKWQAKIQEEITKLGTQAEGTPANEQQKYLAQQQVEIGAQLATERATQAHLGELSAAATTAVTNAKELLNGLDGRRVSPYFEALVGYTFHVGAGRTDDSAGVGLGSELGGGVIGGGFGLHLWGVGASLGGFLGQRGIWGAYLSTTVDLLN